MIKSRTDAEFLISELESEAKLNTKKMLEALEKNNAKNNLLINTSHELRTEINAVNGFVELLNQEPLSENATFYLKTLNQNCQTLSALIDNLTDSIILETGRPTLTARFFNLNDFLEELATTAFFLEKQSNAKLKLSVDKTAKTSVKTDKEKLRRVLHILCSNLMGLDPIEDIELKLNQDSSQNLNFSIQCKTNTTDDAPKKLLQDEMMLPASYTQNAFQNKKGLTIAKTLVNVLGGILSFENAEQKCCFKFTIPQQNIDTEMNEDISNSHLPATLPTSKKESAEPEQMLILIVEDNANSLLLTKTMLKRLHYRTLSAKTPSQALHIIENVNIDAILMDVQLPEINGFDVTQQIRRLEKSKKRRKVPIIALTAYAFENDKQHCLDNGMDDFIAKPIDMTKLKTVLGSLL